MRIVTGIGSLEIVLSRSNLIALLAAVDDDHEGLERSSRTVWWPESIEREHWHPKALLDGHPLRLRVTVEPDEGHPGVPFEIQSLQELAEELVAMEVEATDA